MVLKKISIAGYEIGDFTSLLALLTAGASLIWQFSNWWIGADVRLLQPLRMEFACQHHDACDADSNLMIVIDRLQFVNYGSPGYDMLVDPGAITVSFKGATGQLLKTIELHALYYSKRATDDIEEDPADFVFVKGGSVASHEVEYLPRRIVLSDGKVRNGNFIRFEEFKSWIRNETGPRSVEITINPRPITDKPVPLNTTCRVIIDHDMIDNTSDPAVGSFPRDCSIS